jgi:hypothetical protein
LKSRDSRNWSGLTFFFTFQGALEIDLQMVLGSASETVTVQSGVPVIDAESTSVSTVIDRTYVENLPLNGRSLQTFILLSPGVVLTATAFDDQGQFSVNGQRADANYFTVDGVSANFGVTGFAPLMRSAACRGRAGREHHNSDIVTVDGWETLLGICLRFWGSPVPACYAHRRKTVGTFVAHDPLSSTAGSGLPILELPCMLLRKEHRLSGERRDARAQLI